MMNEVNKQTIRFILFLRDVGRGLIGTRDVCRGDSAFISEKIEGLRDVGCVGSAWQKRKIKTIKTRNMRKN